jgi:Fe-S-cluster-containing dehydrogenase component
MTGYVLAHGNCIGCGRMIAFNPVRVPSLTWKGSREPICADCVERINPRRIANGLPPIVPAPDAYEACREEELPRDD